MAMHWFEWLHTSYHLRSLDSSQKREAHHVSYLPVAHSGAWGTQNEKLWPTRNKRWLVFILWEIILVRHLWVSQSPLWSVSLCTHTSFFLVYLPFKTLNWEFFIVPGMETEQSLVLSSLSPLLTTVSNSWYLFRDESWTCNHRKT